MKINIIICAFLLTISTSLVRAEDGKYEAAMARNIQIVYTSGEHADLLQAVNAFVRIGESEKNKWEPFYYAAFGYIMMANQETNPATKDQYLDQADVNIEKAGAISKNDSEIIALEGFVHMMRIAVDPASRGRQYSGKAIASCRKAISINPENPRAFALLAQVQWGTAQFMGSPTTEACNSNNSALEKFDTFRPGGPLAPVWGKMMAEKMKTQCK